MKDPEAAMLSTSPDPTRPTGTACTTVTTPTIPMIVAQMRQKAEPRNRVAVTASTVTAAITGAAAPCMPAGISVSKLKMMGMIVTVTRMIVVPATVGVMIRRTRGNWPASKKRKSDEKTTRRANSSGPPEERAVTEIAMKDPEAAMLSTSPDPTRPTGTACTTVTTPQMMRHAKVAHER